MKKIRFIIMGIVICPFFNSSFAQTSNSGQTGVRIITTAVPFLTITPDAHSGGLGDAGVAISNDANAMHWNLASVAFFENRFGASFSYTPWLRNLKVRNAADPRFGKPALPDLNLLYFASYYQLGEKQGAIGLSFRQFTLSEITFTDNLGQVIGTDRPKEFAVDLGYTRKKTSSLAAGLSLRYIYSRLAISPVFPDREFKFGSVAADLSMLYNKSISINDFPVQLRTGFNLSNLGPKVSYTGNSSDSNFLPTNLKLGYALTANFNDYLHTITFTNDFNKLLVPSEGGASSKSLLDGVFGSFGDAEGGLSEEISEVTLSLGLEYEFNQLASIRFGYFYEDPLKGNREFFTLGAGTKYKGIKLDVSFLLAEDRKHSLHKTARFTLSYLFSYSNLTE